MRATPQDCPQQPGSRKDSMFLIGGLRVSLFMLLWVQAERSQHREVFIKPSHVTEEASRTVSSWDSTGLQKSLRTYKQGSFLSNGRENTLKVKQIKEWCALSHTANGCVVPQLIKEPQEISRPPGWFQYSPAGEGSPRQMASPGFSKSFILLPQHGRNIESSSWCPSDTWPYPFHGHVRLPVFPPYLAGPLLQAPLSQTFNHSLTHKHQPTAISGIWKGMIAIRLWYYFKRIKIIGFMITPKTLLWDLGLFFITLSVLIKSGSWLLCLHAGYFAVWKSSVLCKCHRNSQNEIYNP